MTKIIAAVLLLLSSSAHAAWTGKLDLTPDVSLFSARGFTAAPVTLSGFEKPLWALYNPAGTKDLGLAPFVAWNQGPNASAIAGGVDVWSPLGTPLYKAGQYVTSAGFTLPQWFTTAMEYTQYVNAGIPMAWYHVPTTWRGLVPGFVGFKLSVTVGGS